MIADVCAGVAALLEPTRQAAIDEAFAEPYEWQPDTLYVYPARVRFSPLESGPTTKQDFELLAIYVGSGAGEASARIRSAEVTALLDAKADGYTRAVASNQRTELWDHLQAAIEPRPPRTLSTRSVALRLSGYRIVSWKEPG